MLQLHGEAQQLRRVRRLTTSPTTRAAQRTRGRLIERTVVRMSTDEGAATAEYAIVTLAAVAFAGLLVAILRSEEVRGMLLDLVQRALSFGV